MTEANILDLAKKLHALAERGVGGEKENAATMLTRLIKKHGLTLDELLIEKPMPRRFEFKSKEHKRFIIQVCASITGTGEHVRYRGVRGVIEVTLTTAQHLEAVIKIEHYWFLLQEKQRLFYRAFIQTNGLARKNSAPPEDRVLTPEELAELIELQRMAASARVATPVKRLERPEKLTA